MAVTSEEVDLMLHDAIQMSFVGIGVPWRRSWWKSRA